MKPVSFYPAFLTALLTLASPIFADSIVRPAAPGLNDAVVMIIRHAEKPENGFELSPAGQQRAQAYAKYFKNLTVDAQALTPDCLFATADSVGSHRPRLTLEPLSHSLGLKIDARVKNKNFHALTSELQAHPHGRHILISWHHGKIPELVKEFGAEPAKLLPGGKWPAEEFSWVLLLRFDHEGRLLPDGGRCIHEKLMPDDK